MALPAPESESGPQPRGFGAGAVLEAVCSAAGSLLARAPGPVARLRVRCGEVSVELHWPSPAAATAPAPPGVAGTTLTTDGPVTTAGAGEVLAEETTLAGTLDLAYICSPMVGTFYHAPSPDAAPFVKVGDVVEAGQQVGVLEAMKLMNPVEAERAGRVVEVLVPDAAPVEFDQRLIAITTADPPDGARE